MNERIKELIKQAGGHWNHGDFNMPSSVEFQEQDIEKFAELIVKDVFVMIKEAVIDGDESTIDEIIDDRLQDAAGDVVDAYGIVDRIY